MAHRKEHIELIRELSKNHWSAKYMLLMAVGYLSDDQVESVVHSELEVAELAVAELVAAYKPETDHQIMERE